MPTKIALISHAFPPSWSGQAVNLGRILRQLDPSSYHLISRQDYSGDDHNFIPRLPGAYHHLPPEFQIPELAFVQQLRRVNFPLAAIIRGIRVARLVKKNACEAVIACSGDISDLPAGWLASRIADVPFCPYLFDDFTYQWPAGVQRDLARFFERFIFKQPAGVIVPNEMLGEEIHKRHGVQFSIVRNCCDGSFLPERTLPSLSDKKQIDIVYTGAIYYVNFSQLRMLTQSIGRVGRDRIKLHLYTATEPEILTEQGICGEHVAYHSHVPSDQVNQIQQNADLLFMPMPFGHPKVALRLFETASPGKMGDYLASGTPVLSMAPPGSFAAWYLRTHEVGLVVDRDDNRVLDETLNEALFNLELRQRLASNARHQALNDFSPSQSARDFLSAVESLT